MKIDRGIKIGEKWIAWEEIEKEERLGKKGKGQGTKDKGTTDRNFN